MAFKLKLTNGTIEITSNRHTKKFEYKVYRCDYVFKFINVRQKNLFWVNQMLLFGIVILVSEKCGNCCSLQVP